MYVIARYKENIDWANNVKKFVVQKDIHLPNIGKEASSYIWFIKNNYNKLTGMYSFRQGNPQPHKVGIFDYKCNHTGYPDHPGLQIKPLADLLDIKIPDILEFTAGAQFDVSADNIKLRSLEWYNKAYNLIMEEYPKSEWIFERLWKYIFDL
jgi:hypothetical protein